MPKAAHLVAAENYIGVFPVEHSWHLGPQILAEDLNVVEAHGELQRVDHCVFVGVLLDLQKVHAPACVDHIARAEVSARFIDEQAIVDE